MPSFNLSILANVVEPTITRTLIPTCSNYLSLIFGRYQYQTWSACT